MNGKRHSLKGGNVACPCKGPPCHHPGQNCKELLQEDLVAGQRCKNLDPVAWSPGRPTCLGVSSLSQLTLHVGPEFPRAPAPGVTCRVRGVEQGIWRAGSQGRWKAKVSAARKDPARSPASAASANQREAQAVLGQSEAAVPPGRSPPAAAQGRSCQLPERLEWLGLGVAAMTCVLCGKLWQIV